MKILLTGNHGYIGSITGPILREAGHEVVGLDTLFYEGCDLYDERGDQIPQVQRDVRDITAADLVGFDAVVHLAALSNDPLGDVSPALTREINFRATVRLAEAARAAGAQRFVFASSCSMYGSADTSAPVDETAPLAPLTAYAESKVRSEEALLELADDAFSPVFMRNATAFGASPRLRLDIVLNNLTAWAYTTSRVRILSDGTPWRPLVHVRDIAHATATIVDAPRELVHAEAFNVGADRDNYQVRQLAEIVRDTVPDCEVEFAGTGDPDPRSYRVDFGKFASTFSAFRFEWDAERGAEELHEAYRRAGLTLADFEGPRFVRLRRLSELRADGSLDPDFRWADGRRR